MKSQKILLYSATIFSIFEFILFSYINERYYFNIIGFFYPYLLFILQPYVVNMIQIKKIRLNGKLANLLFILFFYSLAPLQIYFSWPNLTYEEAIDKLELHLEETEMEIVQSNTYSGINREGSQILYYAFWVNESSEVFLYYVNPMTGEVVKL
ncbi:hypothetical protein [Bacillus sp. 2205SS5-2]|uniref:hypothetical protein n=1 Tax=Bacillus sp. 2205SS5-2 TaxID=3109031 RepID=UPI0030054BF1